MGRWTAWTLAWLAIGWATAQSPPKLVYLVRHAEKVDASRDADLSQTGFRRVETLRHFFKEVPLKGVYASQYQRTQKTVAPIARDKGLSVTVVDAGAGQDLVDRIRKSEAGAYLIAGHSNTAPWLIERLGGPALQIDDSEYDGVFLLVIWEDRAIFQHFQIRVGGP